MNTHDATIRLLKTVPCFTELNSIMLATVAARCQSKSFRAGQLVFMEGNLCRHLYILESGRGKCYRAGAEGRGEVP